jgi:plasmid maintenance system antidote protein VapI
LSQSDLAKKVRIAQSTISNVLKGTRKLTKDQVIKLAEFFHVAPAAFLSSGTTGGQSNRSSGSGAGALVHKIAPASH